MVDCRIGVKWQMVLKELILLSSFWEILIPFWGVLPFPLLVYSLIYLKELKIENYMNTAQLLSKYYYNEPNLHEGYMKMKIT